MKNLLFNDLSAPYKTSEILANVRELSNSSGIISMRDAAKILLHIAKILIDENEKIVESYNLGCSTNEDYINNLCVLNAHTIDYLNVRLELIKKLEVSEEYFNGYYLCYSTNY